MANFTKRDIQILYVEDHLEVLEVVTRVLRHYYNVDPYDNASDALESFKTKKYNIIITDILMHGMDGISLIRKVREIDKDIPIIVATACDDPQIINIIKDEHVDIIKIKPINIECIIKHVDELI